MKTLIDDIAAGETVDFDTLADQARRVFHAFDLLASTPQDPVWHAEGDVETHTRMVVSELYRAMDEHDRTLTADERVALVFGALFHDIAKPFTTTEREFEGEQRIVAPGHADAGRSYIAYSLTELGLDWPTVDAVMALVGHHHDPKQLVRDDAGRPGYARLARHVSPELVYLLELADVRGRECADKEEQLEIIELFRLQCEHFGVWRSAPYEAWDDELTAALSDFDPRTQQFVRAQAIRNYEAGTITMASEELARSYQYRDNYSHLVVLCGPSGAGKSTWTAQNFPDYDLVSLDDLRDELAGSASDQRLNGQVRQLSKERLKESLRANRNVVWDATNLRRDFRRTPLGLGYDYGAMVSLVCFQPAPGEARRNNRSRDRQVPEDVLTRQFESAQFPYRHEAHTFELVR